jgi:hypothetical protein
MAAATRKAHGPSAGGQGIVPHERSPPYPELPTEFALDAKPLSLEQCAAQDREERAKWADYLKIARIEAQ